MVDLKTLATIGEVKLTGKDPNAIIYDAATKRVFTFNEDDNNGTAFDASSALCWEPSRSANTRRLRRRTTRAMCSST